MRVPTATTTHVLCGSSAVYTPYGDRSRRSIASSSLISPALRARSTAYNSSSCSGWLCRSQKKEAPKARRGSAASTSQCSTVCASTSKTRAVARMPSPSAKQGQDADDQLHGALLAMQERAMMLGQVPFARGAVALSPRTAIGMTIRPQVLQPLPGAIGTSSVGTKGHRGVHRPGAAARGGHRIGPSRRRWSRFAGLLVVTQRTGRLVRQARQQMRLRGAFALGLRWSGWGGPDPAQTR